MAPNTRRTRQQRDPVQGDDPVHSPTPQTGTPSKKRLANIPQQDIDMACRSLRRLIFHDDSDEQIKESFKHVWLSVNDALKQDEGLKGRLADENEFFDNVRRNGEKTFIDSLRAMAKTGEAQAWYDLFEDTVFLKGTQAPGVNPPQTADKETTERAWVQTFKGDSAAVLLRTVSSYLDRERDSYSRQATIVNSSGTGKSRMVDELATEIITVPMCLRSDPSSGYPPPDVHLRTWLLSVNTYDQIAVRKKIHAFIYALLTVTRTMLEAIDRPSEKVERIKTGAGVESRQAILATTFRDLMTKGQSYEGPNDYRERFYNQVTQLADKYMEGIQQANNLGFSKEPEGFHPWVSKNRVKDAGMQLAQFVDPNRLLDCVQGQPRRPLVILAFDEAHILTDNPPIAHKTMMWNLFSELRRVLRQTSDQAIFSLFLSTADRFNLISPSPDIRSDPSRRIVNVRLGPLNPITETSFDNLAYDAPEGKIMLSRVVDMDWMCHLGRPLFAAIYDADEIDLMNLAKAKLLDGPIVLEAINRAGSLACLSVRFALEFNIDGLAGDVARTQVEHHMRLCLAATTERETFVTLAGSEPLLAEAAYELMKRTQSNPVWYLATHPDLNCVDRGRRGELVAALLIMRACDTARAASPGQRWISVDGFMEGLLPQAVYQTLKESFPTFYRGGEKYNFAATFQDYGIWCNHIIKVEKKTMFSADHLWKFITRGAMIMCSDNQDGVDIVIPICHTRQALSRHTVTAILVQVKNAQKYQLEMKKESFVKMNPIELGLFPSGVDAKPVIRIVLALASTKAGVDFPEQRGHEHQYNDPFTAFDVRCAGLSNDTFRHVDDDLASYQLLLERSLRPHYAKLRDAFELLEDPKLDDETRRLRGSFRRRMAPLITDEHDAHQAIYLGESKSVA